jgi:glycosyltransferase involved in cell wall biosynthesis|tara:strand:+ start:1148 stop:2278 length:1131 start_codon:yes stop_codon:yes gene_type:complete
VTQNQINQKVTCLQIIPFLGTGGIERGALDIFRHLHSIDIKNYIFCEDYDPKIINKNELKYIFTTNNKKFKNIFSQVSIKKQLLELTTDYKIDLIHVSSRAPAFFLYNFIKNLSVTYITSFHNPYKNQNFIKKYYNSFLLKGDKVVANSYFTKDHINQYYDSHKPVTVIQRGIDVSYFNPDIIDLNSINELKLNLKIDKTDIVIIFPSRLASWKGHELFLKNFSKLKIKNTHSFKIIFFSNNETLSIKIKKFALKIGLDNKLIIVNETNDIRIYYALCDFVVSSSVRPEGFGRTVSEALSMGKLLIAPNEGGTKEQLLKFDNNLLYDVSNLESFKKAVNYAMSNLENNQNRRRNYIISNFSLNSMIKKTIELYGIK